MQPLREYQGEAVEQLVERHKAILADEPGLGKTRTALEAMKRLSVDSGVILIIAPGMATGVWKREIKKWFGQEAIVYTGASTPHKRKKLWERLVDEKIEFLIISYRMIDEVGNKNRAWQGIICDEIHLGGLLNSKSKTYKSLKRLSSRFLFLLTGTPVRKNPADLYGPLSLVNPFEFDNYWRFINKYCVKIDNYFGYEIGPRPRNVEVFKTMLSKYMIRRTKKKVLKELPAKTRNMIPLDMTKEQKRMYDEMAENMIMEMDSGDVVVAAHDASMIVRLRQLLVTPQLLGSHERGAAIEALVELADGEFKSGRSIVVCTPFRDATDMIAKELAAIGASTYIIKGQMKTPAAEIGDAFQVERNTTKALIYTIKSGASFDAYSASTAFFVGYEWSAIDNLQAEDRIHRLGQLDPVNIYYLLHEGTIDEAVMTRLDEKTMAKNWTLHPDEMIKYLTEAKQL